MNSKKWMVVMALLAASVTAGCNTMHGAGQDIERGGEKIQENAR
ncbi:entericidin A/B family lipoprotein [Bordetella petrii]|jgi:predicted small secreted protein|nr:entericidin A/B family lipoprotein [Bordetella petrii]MBO9355204.1 entericidin A/B family lipoprotein [Bordetella petrii]